MFTDGQGSVTDIGFKDTLLTSPLFYPIPPEAWSLTNRVKICTLSPRFGLKIWILCKPEDGPFFISLKDIDIGSYQMAVEIT